MAGKCYVDSLSSITFCTCIRVQVIMRHFYLFLASDNFCQLLITFANSFDPDQDEHNIGLDLDPNHLTL